MKTLSDLPDDLIGEIFSRVPITSLGALRSTCRRWNDLSRTQVVGKKPASNQQFLEFMLVKNKVCSLRFQLQQGIHKDQIFIDSSVNNIRKLEDVIVSKVSQCDGLLLCVTKDRSGILVWNSYLGQIRWIQPIRNNLNNMIFERYALGYDDNKNNRRNHKIVRFRYSALEEEEDHIEVYNLSSNAWRVLDVNSNREKPRYYTAVSLKGNTYFLCGGEEETKKHLLCFDFTKERFGPRLSLPSLDCIFQCVSLSCVRDEKLIVMSNEYLRLDQVIKIWISTKIEPNAVSWSMFFKVVINENNLPHGFPNIIRGSNFFIDEEKKVAVLFDQWASRKFHRRAYIIGEDRYIDYIHIEDTLNNRWDCSHLVGSSYVPSLVQLKVNNQSWRKRKERDD